MNYSISVQEHKNLSIILIKKKKLSSWIKRFRNEFWLISEFAHYFIKGQIFSAISLVFVSISIINMVFGSYRPWFIDAEFRHDNLTKRNILINGYPSPYFMYSDIVCLGYFTTEFILRIICCPDFKAFFKSVFNWVELISLIAFHLEIIPTFISAEWRCKYRGICPYYIVKIESVLELMRITRLVKLFKNYCGMRVMVYTLKSSFKELCLIISLLITGVIFFAFLIYAAEGDPEKADGINNIPISFWFAIITMTTVGFGDILPTSAAGYFIGSLCAVSGTI